MWLVDPNDVPAFACEFMMADVWRYSIDFFVHNAKCDKFYRQITSNKCQMSESAINALFHR